METVGRVRRTRQAAAFAPEVRPSLDWALLLFLCVGLAMAVLGELAARRVYQVGLRDLAVLVFVAAGLIWLLAGWKPVAARWFAILALLALITGGSSALGLPAAMVLVSVPIVAAAQLLGLGAAAAVAGASTALMLLPTVHAALGADLPTVALVLVGAWATWLLLVGVYSPVYRLGEWWEWHFARSQALLETARDRKAELEQALASLVNANRQLALANERVAVLRQMAEEAQRAKAQFVAKVSHEFRTPLNMIIGLVNLMVENPRIYTVTLPPEMTKDLEIVRRNSQHLAGMVNDVLSLAQMEAHRLVLHRENADLAELVAVAVEAVSPLTSKKGLRLEVIIEEGLPLVYCDRTRIQQVVLNLVSNAARYTERGGITVKARLLNGHVLMSVSDTGPGIPEGETDRIFEPFYQAASERWRDKGGTGLGLSISREFVRRHGGRMWVESELGVGSTFNFELPISQPTEPATAPDHRIREDWIWRQDAFLSTAALAAQPDRPRIIVWDQGGGLASELDGHVEEAEFVYAANAQDLGEAVSQAPAHAVIVNASAPEEVPGLVELARSAVSGTPLVGCAVPRRAARALQAGASGYLVKPVGPADLWEVMQNTGRVVERVLVVDDDPDFVRLVSRMLQVSAPGLHLAAASNGEEALAALRAQPFDLVLLDVMMPGLDGWKVLEQKRQDPTLLSIPTFLVSARDPVEEPPVSSYIVAAADGGLSVSQVLECSLRFSAQLLNPHA